MELNYKSPTLDKIDAPFIAIPTPVPIKDRVVSAMEAAVLIKREKLSAGESGGCGTAIADFITAIPIGSFSDGVRLARSRPVTSYQVIISNSNDAPGDAPETKASKQYEVAPGKEPL